MPNLKDIEETAFEEDNNSEMPPPDMVAYNELRSCADLYRMHKQGILNLSPDFQRNVVWNPKDQTRFIDSLTKQLPIPSMCFAADNKLQKWMVIDGLQRISTIIKFLSGDDPWVLSKLDDINPELSNQSIQELKVANSSLHHYYTRIENLTLPITVLRCHFSKQDHMAYLFTIFHRLNTGGIKLNNQEIRNCIYSGSFNDLLKNLDNNQKWLGINKLNESKRKRMVGRELILRFFCFHETYESYTGKLSSFLNNYMHAKKILSDDEVEKKQNLFHATMDVASKLLSDRSRISITLMEAVLVGIAFSLEKNKPISELKIALEKLTQEPEFSEAEIQEGLAQKNKVIGRLNKAKQIFCA